MNPCIFALSGLSECGKSTAGRYFQSAGVERLKIVRFISEVKTDDGAADDDYGDWIERARVERRGWLNEQFAARLLDYVELNGLAAVSIESLYDPVLTAYLKGRLGSRFVVVFIDIPRQVRLQRQMARENLTSLEDAARYLDPRDETKVGWGALAVRAQADEVIDNSGTVQDLHAKLQAMLRRYLGPFSETVLAQP